MWETQANESDSYDEPKRKKSHRNDSEYGVSRGLDFWNVSFVVNVDFPTLFLHSSSGKDDGPRWSQGRRFELG
jgi:hypothetical protein